MRKAVYALGMVALMVFSIYGGMVVQANADQQALYRNAIAHPNRFVFQSGAYNSSAASFNVGHNTTISFGVVIFRPHDSYANQTRTHGVPDCIVLCPGIHYFQDPTVIIVDTGRDFEQCVIYKYQATACGTITIVAGDTATYLGWSKDTHTPAHGDTWAGGATIPCSSTNEITTGGLDTLAGTVTFGAAGTTVTTTVTHLFTAAETDTAVQVSCILTEDDASAHPNIYAEGTFGPDTLNSGDTITPTWSIART